GRTPAGSRRTWPTTSCTETTSGWPTTSSPSETPPETECNGTGLPDEDVRAAECRSVPAQDSPVDNRRFPTQISTITCRRIGRTRRAWPDTAMCGSTELRVAQLIAAERASPSIPRHWPCRLLKHPSPLVVTCTGSANAYSQRHNPSLQREVMALTGRSAEARWCGRHLDQAWARSELGPLKHGLDRDGLEISPGRSRRSSRERPRGE